MDFKILQNHKQIAVALSGGGDSMALSHMMCKWAQMHGDIRIHLLTVNHNLRDDSKVEAEQVAQWVNDFPCATHVTLTWEHDKKPETAIMEQARQARYDLMTDYCRTHSIQTLCVGHHGDDNIETFLFRLAKGSGLDGLSGMNEWSEKNSIKIHRPLLNTTHDELINYCKINGLKWIDDPSNENEQYARPRLRKALMAEGLDTKRFAKTIGRLSRAQEALNDIASKTFLSLVKQNAGHEIYIDFAILKSYPLDIQIRVVQKAIADMGCVTHDYPPKLERIEDIVDSIKPNKSATLHGCVLSLSKDGNTLEIKRS